MPQHRVLSRWGSIDIGMLRSHAKVRLRNYGLYLLVGHAIEIAVTRITVGHIAADHLVAADAEQIRGECIVQ